jgi:hypothetical protein
VLERARRAVPVRELRSPNEKGPVRGPCAAVLLHQQLQQLRYCHYNEPPTRGRISFCTYFTPMTLLDPKTLPFDGKRMIYGGFKTFVEL